MPTPKMFGLGAPQARPAGAEGGEGAPASDGDGGSGGAKPPVDKELERIRARMPTPKMFGLGAPQARPAGAERGEGAPRATAMGGPAGRSPPVDTRARTDPRADADPEDLRWGAATVNPLTACRAGARSAKAEDVKSWADKASLETWTLTTSHKQLQGHRDIRRRRLCDVGGPESHIGLTGGYQSPFIGLRFLSMFIPALAMLCVRPGVAAFSGSIGIAFPGHTCRWRYC